MHYRVIRVTNNVDDYPEYKKQSLKFPGLVQRIVDEIETYIVSDSGEIYTADEFFHSVNVRGFVIT